MGKTKKTFRKPKIPTNEERKEERKHDERNTNLSFFGEEDSNFLDEIRANYKNKIKQRTQPSPFELKSKAPAQRRKDPPIRTNKRAMG